MDEADTIDAEDEEEEEEEDDDDDDDEDDEEEERVEEDGADDKEDEEKEEVGLFNIDKSRRCRESPYDDAPACVRRSVYACSLSEDGL